MKPIRGRYRLLPVAPFIALRAAVLAGGPVLAFAPDVSGTTGTWVVIDTDGSPGAECEYDDEELLVEIAIRPPEKVWGAYAQATWVGWKFKILRRKYADGPWKVIFTSSTRKDTATLPPQSADFGTVFRTWQPPATDKGWWYKVRLVLLFYKPGSKKVVEGRTVGDIASYLKWSPYYNVAEELPCVDHD